MAYVKRYTFKRRPLYKRRRISRLATKKTTRKRRVLRSRFSTRRIPGTQLIGTSNCKIHRGLAQTLISRNGRKLYMHNCFTNIPRTSPTGQLNTNGNARERDVINLRGIKINMHVRNDVDRPIIFHYAILVDRTPLTAPVAQNDLAKDFFRNPGYLTGDRSRDFESGIMGIDMGAMGINTDRWLVLKHKRIMLHPKLNGFGNYNPNHKNWIDISKYMSINRQLRYDVSSFNEGYCLTRIYLAHWADSQNSDPALGEIVEMYHSTMTCESFFRETD